MRASFWVGLVLLMQILAAPGWAGTIQEADYPNEYTVVSANKGGKLMGEKSCTMTLHDKAKADVDINVSKKGFGSCHVLETGKVYRGRENEKKNQIEIVIPVGTDKARVENWEIIGTVDTNPS